MDTCDILQSIPSGNIGMIVIVFIFVRFLEKYVARKEPGQPPGQPPGEYYPPG